MAGSATEITMPQMGAEMEEGTLLRWIKHPGDHVARGEVIAEIETDKANIEIESFEEGVLQQTLAEEGQVIPVGQVIATISKAGDGAPPAPSAAAAPPAAEATSPSAAAAAAPSEPELRGAVAPREEAATAVPAPTPSAPEDSPASPDRPVQPATSAGGAAGSPSPDGATARGRRLRVSPVAAGIAQELGLDLRTISGSGPDGRIMRKDVERAAEQRKSTAVPVAGDASPPRPAGEAMAATAAAPPAAAEVTTTALIPPAPAAPATAAAVPAQPPPVEGESLSPAAATQPAGTAAPVQAAAARQAAAPPTAAVPVPTRGATTSEGVVPFTRMRQAIARNMAASKREAPHYYVTAEVDMTEAMQFRATLNDEAGDSVHVSVNDLIVKACADLLRRYPRFNASYTEGGLRMHDQINVCIAVALPDGLIAPALLDAGGKSLGAIAREAKDLADRARKGGLKGPELSEGTFTISNLGMYGIETLIPIIQLPQSAILGVGGVLEKPAVHEGQIVIRQLMMVALAADHRVTDGAEGGEFLRELKRLLEHPIGLAL